MRRFLVATICGIALMFWSASATTADPDGCRGALDQFNSAQSSAAAAVTPYSDCIADNDGHESCSQVFANLQSAQASFASAVSQYGRECE
jgi:hypothetical protein